jgi:hypothetical protein
MREGWWVGNRGSGMISERGSTDHLLTNRKYARWEPKSGLKLTIYVCQQNAVPTAQHHTYTCIKTRDPINARSTGMRCWWAHSQTFASNKSKTSTALLVRVYSIDPDPAHSLRVLNWFFVVIDSETPFPCVCGVDVAFCFRSWINIFESPRLSKLPSLFSQINLKS